MKTHFSIAADMNFKNLGLPVPEKLLTELHFWEKSGFYEIDCWACDGFDNDDITDLYSNSQLQDAEFVKHPVASNISDKCDII